MSVLEFFTNNDKTRNKEVEVEAPAFSATKVQASLGALIVAVLGAVPPALQADETIGVAAIASGTLVMLGVFALVAVDIATRQKAAKATLRYGKAKAAEARFQAMAPKDLVLQLGHNTDEYEVRYASVEGDAVHLYADRDGTPVAITFKESPKPK